MNDFNAQSLNDFLADLSELSRKYGIGIGGDAWPYVMECEDFRNVYICSETGKLAVKEV